MIQITFLPTPIGKMGISAEDGRLVRLFFDISGLPEQWVRDNDDPLLRETVRQMNAYFAGGLRAFDLPYRLDAPSFTADVLEQLKTVPYGQTTTYRALAAAVGKPEAARAVGQALHRNPLPILLPCHRVLPADGRLGGYALGAERKRYLLALESRVCHG